MYTEKMYTEIWYTQIGILEKMYIGKNVYWKKCTQEKMYTKKNEHGNFVPEPRPTLPGGGLVGGLGWVNPTQRHQTRFGT
jgi:hypothetical protein